MGLSAKFHVIRDAAVCEMYVEAAYGNDWLATKHKIRQTLQSEQRKLWRGKIHHLQGGSSEPIFFASRFILAILRAAKRRADFFGYFTSHEAASRFFLAILNPRKWWHLLTQWDHDNVFSSPRGGGGGG